MATKQNMYVGLDKEIEKTLNEIKDSIILYCSREDGFIEILGYDISKAKENRDHVVNCQGRIQIAIKGLDKNSNKREGYEKLLRQIDHFLEVTKQ